MNIRNISAGLVLLTVVGAALAEAPYPVESEFVSTKTRAEVIAELQQAREHGLVVTGDEYPAPAVAKSSLTRQQVQDELKQANQQRSHNLSYAELVFLR